MAAVSKDSKEVINLLLFSSVLLKPDLNQTKTSGVKAGKEGKGSKKAGEIERNEDKKNKTWWRNSERKKEKKIAADERIDERTIVEEVTVGKEAQEKDIRDK